MLLVLRLSYGLEDVGNRHRCPCGLDRVPRFCEAAARAQFVINSARSAIARKQLHRILKSLDVGSSFSNLKLKLTHFLSLLVD